MLVREELRATTSLAFDAGDDEPDLVGEGGSALLLKPAARVWTLQNTRSAAQSKTQPVVVASDTARTSNNKDGLRNRKTSGGGASSTTTPTEKPKMTVTQEEEAMDQETLLRMANPIDLFGAFPPRNLRTSQKDAYQALQEYIEAANFAVALLKIMEKK